MSMSIQSLSSTAILLHLLSNQFFSGHAWQIEFFNNCNYTVWPASATSSFNFSLPKNSSHNVNVTSIMGARLWGRTSCHVSDGRFACKTGDCGSGNVSCSNYSPLETMPTTIVDLSDSDSDQGRGYMLYDVSVVDGYNLPVMVVPRASMCQATGCVFDIVGACPKELKQGGACANPCSVNISSGECNSTYLSNIMDKTCPLAYSNPSTDGANVFTCSETNDHSTIVFCPSPQLMSSALKQSQQSPSPKSQVPALSSPSPSPKSSPRKRNVHIYLVVAIPIAILIILLLGIWVLIKRKRTMKRHNEISKLKYVESFQLDLNTIKSATHNFSLENKLGEGGFGKVYKGMLEGGREIAVKRLSETSRQGVIEFKTEVLLVTKLQHKNLVKLLGYCVTSNENLLVYEYLPNSSLDKFLFDPMIGATLDWQTRLKIVIGIARGLLYLHEDSRLKVIHRDLKTSNILLDQNMNPKISDFGLAKLFEVDQTQGETKRIIGTYGYMAPEYALTGHYSVKSDVYSFGVIVLEIISGQKSKFLIGGEQHEEALLHRAWRLWNEGKSLDLVDRELKNFKMEELMKCIHIGMLCIQEDATQRPTMASIVAAFRGHSVNLPIPNQPTFFGHHASDQNASPRLYTGTNTITHLYPRQ